MDQFDAPKLSLVAQYDDLVRFVDTLISNDNIEISVKKLLQNCEKQRLIWLLERNELVESKETIKKLKDANKCLETTLKNVREAFKKELNLREKIQDERDLLFKKLTNVQKIILEDSVKNSEAGERILSSLNLNKLKSVIEVNSSDEESISSIEFDKTDEDILGNNNLITKNTNSNYYSLLDNKRNSKNLHDNNDYKNESKNLHLSTSPKKVEDFDENKMDYDILEDLEKEDHFDDESVKETPAFKSTASIASRLSNLSQSLIKRRLSVLPNELKVENRKHSFVIKKVFRPGEKCGPCGGSIGFCTSCYNCRDCRAICHISCKDKVPLPCIPYVSKANIGKQGRLVLISDFAPLNCRPCVPAIIIHCCAEIEKRGFDEIGLYRIPGSDKEVKDLKEKILKSKNGIPLLNKVDIHVLCGVVKMFLRQLDESLITRLAWRDFVKAVLLEDEEQKISYLQDSISDLPIANRDTLAYLVLHLQKISISPACKMPISNLSKVFGPTIVGYSMRDPPAMQMYEENRKQILVMEAILNLEASFLENLLCLNIKSPVKKSEEEISCLNEINCSNNSFMKNSLNLDNKRISIGSRFYGGRVMSGTLTPLKAPNSKIYHAKPAAIKPLF